MDKKENETIETNTSEPENNESQQIKNTKKENKFLLFLVVLIVAVVGIISGIQYKTYKENEMVDLKNETVNYLSSEHKKSEIEETLKTNFSKLSKEDCTYVVDLYLHATYALASQSMVDDDMTNVLYGIMDENRKFDFDKIEDNDLREYCIKLADQNVVLRFVNGDLFFDVDYGYFVDTYGQYINDDYAAVLRLYNEEKINDYYDSGTNTMYYETVEKRLKEVYDLMQEYPNATTLTSMKNYYEFYKKIYLGAYAQDYVFESGAKVKEEVLNRYKEFVETVKDEEFNEFLTKLINDYEGSDRSRTVDIYSEIKEFCGVKDTNS